MHSMDCCFASVIIVVIVVVSDCMSLALRAFLLLQRFAISLQCWCFSVDGERLTGGSLWLLLLNNSCPNQQHPMLLKIAPQSLTPPPPSVNATLTARRFAICCGE